MIDTKIRMKYFHHIQQLSAYLDGAFLKSEA